MKKVIKFTNFSNEEFVGYWDGTPWNVKAGETIMLQEYLAVHFAKHLIDRELNKKDESTSNEIEREKMLKICLVDVVAETESEEKAETETLNQKTEVTIYLSRKDLNKVATEEGIEKPEDLENKQKVIDAINDKRKGKDNKGEKDELEDGKDKDESEEDEFKGNN